MRRWGFIGSAFLLGLSGAGQAAEPPEPFQVIVHPSNPVSALSPTFVAEIFLKKVSRWPDGEPILPVDQAPRSSLRVKFVERILHRSLSAVRNYWQQLIFSGRGLPPPELEGDAEVLRYVLRNPGAIGYVSSGFDVDKARVISLSGAGAP
jgi:ABC-type phosphate transport system substrate-binding protein